MLYTGLFTKNGKKDYGFVGCTFLNYFVKIQEAFSVMASFLKWVFIIRLLFNLQSIRIFMFNRVECFQYSFKAGTQPLELKFCKVES